MLGFNKAENACLTKRRFDSDIEARNFAQDLIRTGKSTVPELFVYGCRFCGGFHLTKHHDDPRAPGVTAHRLFSSTVRYSVLEPRGLGA